MEKSTGSTLQFTIPLIIILLVTFWYFKGSEISYLSLILSKMTINFFNMIYFIEPIGKYLSYIFFAEYSDSILMSEIAENIKTIHPDSMTFKETITFFEFAFTPIRIPFIVIMLFLIAYNFKHTAISRSKRRFTFETLVKVTKEFYPITNPHLQMKLLDRDPDKGITRREEGPIRYSINNCFLSAYRKDRLDRIRSDETKRDLRFGKKNKTTDSTIIIEDHLTKGLSLIHGCCVFDQCKAEEIFAKQLGGLFTSLSEMKIYEKFLAICFIEFSKDPDLSGDLNIHKKTALGYLNDFNKKWKKSNFIASSIFTNKETPRKDIEPYFPNELISIAIKESENRDDLHEIFENHAFNSTVLLKLLERARRKGKLYPDLFGWLKYTDRSLWWALNSLGGQTDYCEGAGIMAHYKAEKKILNRIKKPYVKYAVLALNKQLQRRGWLHEAN